MAQQGARAQKSRRQARESANPRRQHQSHEGREAATEATRVAGQLAGLGPETLTVWSGTGQRALRDVVELSAQASQEGARQLTYWQQANLELLREAQTLMLRWSTVWPEYIRDPIRGYQRSLEESIEAGHRVIELTRRNAETLAQSCQRLERAADVTTRTLGETFREASTRMQDVYARSDRLRAA
jgi:hypothetical protein